MSSRYGFQRMVKEEKEELLLGWQKRQQREQEREFEMWDQRQQRNVQAAQPFDVMVRDVLADFYTTHGHSEAAQKIKGPNSIVSSDEQRVAWWSLSHRGDLLVKLYFDRQYQPTEFRVRLADSALGLPSGESSGPPTKQGLIDALKELEKPEEYVYRSDVGTMGDAWLAHSGSGEVW
ncbi:MAG: hypothetical protein FJ044_04125 [Candidatus Cloacimonetes bacterium]|nr:hypothetical protein [Candidatus Cloacimonadota bacterium]